MSAKKLLITGVVLILLIAGCASGSKRLSKQEYVDQVNKICTKYQDEIDKVSDESSANPLDENMTEEEMAKAYGELLDKALVLSSKASSEIKSRKPPAADQDEVDEINEKFDKAINESEKVVDDLKSGDSSSFEEFDEDPFVDYNKAAKAYGLDECGEG